MIVKAKERNNWELSEDTSNVCILRLTKTYLHFAKYFPLDSKIISI